MKGILTKTDDIERIMNKKVFFIFGMFLLFGILIILNSDKISGVGEVSYCCEKTTEGAWCQNVNDASKCNEDFRTVPTSCEATSYCKMGTCIDNSEGVCMENTPERVCSQEKGIWQEGKPYEIPQCQLGCCLIGEQAAFTTQTRCKKISSLYGLETNYRADITDEVQCIESATANVKGACVFDKDFEKTCKFITKRECRDIGTTSGNETEFYDGFLCSAEQLGTNCGASKKTTCVEERDEVYFVDTCGNLANIYDAGKVDEPAYWNEVVSKEESCSLNLKNNEASCGSCDYYAGSTCKLYKAEEDSTRPKYGDNICRDLNCKYDNNNDGKISNDETFQHGETWCGNSPGVDENLPGSRDFRLVCYNNEITIEPCAEFRQEICVQSNISSFKTAACRVNKWQDCSLQDNEADCTNEDSRDCKWIVGISILKDENGNPFVLNNDGNLVRNNGTSQLVKDSNGKYIQASCAPKYAPGFDFWNSEGDAQTSCAFANSMCIITYDRSISEATSGKPRKPTENLECLPGGSWQSNLTNLCVSFGDCGVKKNYLDFDGSNNWEDSFSGEGYDS
ncbi:MAG: hypothetical protein AABX28_01110 [Nanoarchaeota archaeon]